MSQQLSKMNEVSDLVVEFLRKPKNLLVSSAIGFGLIALMRYYRLVKKNGKKYKYPTEVGFANEKGSDGFQISRKEFLDKFSANFEEYLIAIREKYPNECTLTLTNSDCNYLSCLSSMVGLKKSQAKKIIFINSIESVKKFSKTSEKRESPISNRPKNLVFGIISKNYLGSFFRMNDEKLKEIRKSSVNGLHKLINTNAADFEANLSKELNELVKFFSQASQSSTPLDEATIYLQQFATNIIIMLGLGARLPYELGKDAAIKKQIRNITALLSSLTMIDLTLLDTPDLEKGTLDPAAKMLDEVYKFLLDSFSAYKAYDGENIATYADFVLAKRDEKLKLLGKLNSFECFSSDDILVQFFTLFMAGATTTGFSIMWLFYFLSRDKQIQNKLYEEIAAYTDSYGQALNEDGVLLVKQRDHLKYANACVSEALRLGSTQALIPRATIDDVSIDNGAYELPANTTIVINTYAMHTDAANFDKPNEFKPERWLNESSEETTHEKKKAYIPFGYTPRLCIAENISKNLIFALMVNIVRNFELEHVLSEAPAAKDSISKLGVMRRPLFYNLKLTRRT